MALQCLLRYILLLMLVFMVLHNVRQPIFPFLSLTSYPADTQGSIFGVTPTPWPGPPWFSASVPILTFLFNQILSLPVEMPATFQQPTQVGSSPPIHILL